MSNQALFFEPVNLKTLLEIIKMAWPDFVYLDLTQEGMSLHEIYLPMEEQQTRVATPYILLDVCESYKQAEHLFYPSGTDKLLQQNLIWAAQNEGKSVQIKITEDAIRVVTLKTDTDPNHLLLLEVLNRSLGERLDIFFSIS